MPRILVVDDNHINRVTLKNQLKHLGLEAETAADAKTALMQHQANPYTIVLLDYNMPDISGAELGQQIRNIDHPFNRHTHLFSISADSDMETTNAFASIHIVKHLQKPVSQDMLSSALAEWLAPADAPTKPADVSADPSGTINWVELKKWLPVDPAELKEFLEEFNQTTIEGIHIMEDAIQNGDYSEIANSAHRLKAPPKAFGMTELANTLAQIQQAATLHVNRETMLALLAELKRCHKTINAEINIYVAALR